MARHRLVLPKMGESVTEATIIKWNKSLGDFVEIDEVLVEIATDKVDSEVPSPVKGKLILILCNENEVVEVGSILGIIDTDETEHATVENKGVEHPQLVEDTVAFHTAVNTPDVVVETENKPVEEYAHAQPPLQHDEFKSNDPKFEVIADIQEEDLLIEDDEENLPADTKDEQSVKSLLDIKAKDKIQKNLFAEDDDEEELLINDAAPEHVESLKQPEQPEPVVQQFSSRFYSPLVKSIALHEGISFEQLNTIPGTGADGRLTKEDLLLYIKTPRPAQASEAAPIAEHHETVKEPADTTPIPELPPIAPAVEQNLFEPPVAKLYEQPQEELIETVFYREEAVVADIPLPAEELIEEEEAIPSQHEALTEPLVEVPTEKFEKEEVQQDEKPIEAEEENILKSRVRTALPPAEHTEEQNMPEPLQESLRFYYSPLVQSIAAREGIGPEELDKVPGSGLDGRVTKNDLLLYIMNRNVSDEDTNALEAHQQPKQPEILIQEPEKEEHKVTGQPEEKEAEPEHVAAEEPVAQEPLTEVSDYLTVDEAVEQHDAEETATEQLEDEDIVEEQLHEEEPLAHIHEPAQPGNEELVTNFEQPYESEFAVGEQLFDQIQEEEYEVSEHAVDGHLEAEHVEPKHAAAQHLEEEPVTLEEPAIEEPAEDKQTAHNYSEPEQHEPQQMELELPVAKPVEQPQAIEPIDVLREVVEPQTHQHTPHKKHTVSVSGDDEVIEMDRMRRLIAEHMVMSVQTSPHVTSFIEADVTNFVLWREKVKAAFEEREGSKLTFTPMFIECVARAIKDFPMINVTVNGTQIIKKQNINIGMATALPSGNLIVPVIRKANELSITDLTKAVNDLSSRARNNKLQPDEVKEGTFTITNVGTFGNLMGTPIINQPQVAILALGAIKKKPAVIETESGDAIAIRQMMFLSLSYDHRVVDGSLGGAFIQRIAQYLESWDVKREL